MFQFIFSTNSRVSVVSEMKIADAMQALRGLVVNACLLTADRNKCSEVRNAFTASLANLVNQVNGPSSLTLKFSDGLGLLAVLRGRPKTPNPIINAAYCTLDELDSAVEQQNFETFDREFANLTALLVSKHAATAKREGA